MPHRFPRTRIAVSGNTVTQKRIGAEGSIMIVAFKDKTPVIGEHVFIAPTAVVIGEVSIGDNSSIWFNAVVRGDLAPIHIGSGTNIQDNCTLHTDAGIAARIGNYVTVGHNAVLHGCTIQSHVLIGMGVVILNHAVIKEGAVVAAHALVKERQIIETCSLVAGVPATLKKWLGPKSIRDNEGFAHEYEVLSELYMRGEYPPNLQGQWLCKDHDGSVETGRTGRNQDGR